jgi:hypothetical protein
VQFAERPLQAFAFAHEVVVGPELRLDLPQPFFDRLLNVG